MTKKSESGATTRHVAFLRGINVGGKNIIRMEAVKQALAALGLLNVRTVLASGNVLFDSPEKVGQHCVDNHG